MAQQTEVETPAQAPAENHAAPARDSETHSAEPPPSHRRRDPGDRGRLFCLALFLKL